MATPKSNAVQNNNAPIYVLYDSSVPNSDTGYDTLSRSLSRARTKFIQTALNDIKGLVFSNTHLRVLYCEEGFNGNKADTIRLEFTALYGTGMGKASTALGAATGQYTGDSPKPTL